VAQVSKGLYRLSHQIAGIDLPQVQGNSLQHRGDKMNAQQLRWWTEAEEQATPVETAEEFSVWTVADEASLEGLMVVIGREQWEALQDRHEADLRLRGSRVA
jgi:hypothetical protein